MRRVFLRGMICAALAAVATTTATATAGAYTPAVPPNGTLFGATYGEWFGRWLNWAVTPPAATNPLANPKNCKITPQPGNRVWFLTPSSGGKLTQSCTIPRARAIFVPIAGNLGFAETPKDTFATLRPGAVIVFKEASVLQASIDGQPVPGLRSYKSQTRNLLLRLPGNNIFQLAPGPTRFVAAGFNLLVTGLSPGKHTIVTYTELKSPGQPAFKAGMTYRLTIE